MDVASSIQKKEEKVIVGKKRFFLPLILFLIALGLVSLSFILTNQKQRQEQEVLAPIAEKREINPARVYNKPELAEEYILEGIIYDPKAPFALINGRVIKESDELDGFRIDKISKDRVDMTNIKDNNKVTLSLPD